MPVAVACPKCQKKFNLPDAMRGKPVKCSECGAQFRTPGKPVQNQKQRPTPQQLAAQKKAQAEAQRKAAELKKLGVDGTIQRAPDVFDGLGQMQGTPDPLNNMMVEDVGFEAFNVNATVHEMPQDDATSGMLSNPALQTAKPKSKSVSKKKKKKKKHETPTPWYGQPWFVCLATFTPLFTISILLSFFGIWPANVASMVNFMMLIVLAFVNISVGWWGIGIIYEELDLLHAVLSVFIPFYIILPIVWRWNELKQFVFASLALTLVGTLGQIAVVVATLSILGES